MRTLITHHLLPLHPDIAGAAGPEVFLPLGEHLEVGRVILAKGAVHWATRGPAARLLW